MSQAQNPTMKPASFKSTLRTVLGDNAYRIVSQSPRILRMILNPSYEYETAATATFLKEGSVCFDVGGHYGLFSRFMSPLVGKTGQIYAFEPSSITCGVFKTVKRVCGLRNIHIENCALSDAPGSLTLTIPVKAHGGLGTSLAFLGTGNGVNETVRVRTLDDFAQEHNLQRCDFIKCDVEGAEFMMLKGALKTITQFKPVLMFEVDAKHLTRNSHTIADIETVLRGLNYTFFLWKDGKFAPINEMLDKENVFCMQAF